ncbi:hypothetical protein NVS55_38295 [Myxococcus stipitatus]|uniref:hypothetical protein n=1 Tax=Myxococcus stipitatus TaxID=83455 RepID=UPI0031454835
MPGHPPRLLRWLRLVLACLTLVGGGAAAHTPPPPVSVAAQAGGPTAVPQAPELVRYARLAPREVSRLTAPAAPPASWRHVPLEPPGPPRRLFLLHRSLLH